MLKNLFVSNLEVYVQIFKTKHPPLSNMLDYANTFIS